MSAWPPFSAGDRPTIVALHLMSQVVGKVPTALLPWRNHGWHLTLRVGEVINIPANAPHQFQNKSKQAARLLCLCSPAGQEEFFQQVGVSVASRTTPPPPADPAQQQEIKAKTEALAPEYKTELLKP